ncbi:MAG: hypothetical protein JNL19_08650 [Burkholderiales bacterium]|nr:hypothetical protein [Burkholderiales bacterium]
MSNTAAKDLLAQADRLMKQRLPEELPVLTDLVVEEIEVPSLDRTISVGGQVFGPDDFSRPARTPAQPPTGIAPAATPVVVPPPAAVPLDAIPVMTERVFSPPTPPAVSVAAAAPVSAPPVVAAPTVSTPAPAPVGDPSAALTAIPNVREQFNAQLATKLEELRHAVFNQAMQQLELHADGSLKKHLRDSLSLALAELVQDMADQVAEDTASRVREVVGRAVDTEIARLREQLSKRRG